MATARYIDLLKQGFMKLKEEPTMAYVYSTQDREDSPNDALDEDFDD